MANHKKVRLSNYIGNHRIAWFFTLFLIACVGLSFYLSKTNSNESQPNAELPVVSNENNSEGTDSDALYGEKPIPTEDEVLAARQQATAGMSQQQIKRMTEVIKAANLWLEHQYMYNNLFDRLSDPDDLYWNYFHQTGEIQIDWAIDGSIDKDAICKRENLSSEEFYEQYGTPVVTTNRYNADDVISLLSEIDSTVHNENLKAELLYLMDQIEQAKESHSMEIVNEIYKKIHDLDYFLLRYGPIDVAKYVEDDTTVSKYYGTLSFYR